MKQLLKISVYVIFSANLILLPGWKRDFSSQFTGDTTDIKETTPKEKIILHTDRGRYIAGENMWFSFATTGTESGKITDLSSLVYIELINPWSQPVIQGRFNLREGIGEGFFQLPDSLSSGTYTIRAYTNHLKNFLPEKCFMNDVEIYNPFRTLSFRERRIQSSSASNTPMGADDAASYVSGNIASDSIFGRRQKVALKIFTNIPEISNLNISVVPAHTEECLNPIQNDKNSRENWPERYGFEKNVHLLTLRIRYRDGSKIDSSGYLFRSVQGKVAEFSYAERDSAGLYTFQLPVDDEERRFIIQPEVAGSGMTLEKEPSYSWLILPSVNTSIELPDSIINVFSMLSFNYQASGIYKVTSFIKKETREIRPAKIRRFYGIPEMEILLSDYISLPTMQEVFFELLPGIIMKPVKDGYQMLITNPLTGSFYSEPPLVMIDGIIINDLNVLAGLNPERVEKVEVVKTPYLTGDLILHGIVNVITKSGDFSENSIPDYSVLLPYRVVEKVPAFFSPDYSDPDILVNRIPDLRNTLYWNPLVQTNATGEASVDFNTSDLAGEYTISVNGISETGKNIFFRKSFIIRPFYKSGR